MTHAQHTPGPWLVSNGTKICNMKGELIATMDRGRTEADARLCASALILLEALEYLLEDHRDDCVKTVGQVRKARAAIAQATGQGE